jgi:hypothetical protein
MNVGGFTHRTEDSISWLLLKSSHLPRFNMADHDSISIGALANNHCCLPATGIGPSLSCLAGNTFDASRHLTGLGLINV